jgi:DNA-binding IclR family transcriptional regulator
MASSPQPPSSSRDAARHSWSLLSNHGHVLVTLAHHPRMRIRDLAATVGITERACYRIVGDLVEAGMLRRERVGRNNRYTVELSATLSHPASRGLRIGSLLDAG